MKPRSFSLTRSRSQCARPGADHYEHGRGGDLFTLAGPDVLERQGFQAGLAVAVGNSGAEPDVDVGVAISWVMRVIGHAGGQRLAPCEQRDPGGEFGQLRAA
jgi:hypothetical protein